MFDRSDLLWRDDDPTPATTPARDDHAKDDQAARMSGIARMKPPASTRARDPEARHLPRRSRTARTRDAVADVGLYRAVSYTDLSDQHFDGHPSPTRRSVNHMIRAGLIEEHEATGRPARRSRSSPATARRPRRSSPPRTTSGCTSSITTRCCIPTPSSTSRTPMV